ncbi:MAG: mechanosensitive ion channel family protein [Treponema sp.]|nr:mechanosensitive ion channel family protein [Treponema sp.]MBQ9538449.1 mechanosensitive ion channel family protein [Treponema sp.]
MEEESSTVADAVQTVAETASETVHTVTEVAADTIGTVTKGVSSETASLLHIDEIKGYFTVENVTHWVTSIIALLIFYIAYRIIKKLLKRQLTKFAKPHTVILVSKTISYTFRVLMIMYVLNLFGVNLSAIWGAAGVAGLAIGFAAQTSVSNIISGVFVVSEKAMKIGDCICVDGTTGIVDSIDLLSVKVHTFDNQMVRIPNSTIINGSLTNYNHFDVRRVVVEVGVSYNSDVDAVLEALQKVPSMCPTVIAEPAPKIYYDSFGASSINLKVCLWCKNPDFIATKNDAFKAIVKVSRETPFEIPYTKLDVKIVNPAQAAL